MKPNCPCPISSGEIFSFALDALRERGILDGIPEDVCRARADAFCPGHHDHSGDNAALDGRRRVHQQDGQRGHLGDPRAGIAALEQHRIRYG